MSSLTTTLSVTIAGGDTVSASSEVIEAEATGQIDIEIAAGTADLMVEIQPSASTQIHVLLLSSSFYGSGLTYVFNDGTSDADDILTLDGPQMFSAGSLAAISVNPTQIKLSMAASPAGEDATVSIFVARDATP